MMTFRCLLFCLLGILPCELFAQSVGIHTNSPHPSAALDIGGNQQGFLPPRLTLTERNAISNPAHGLVVYNTTDGCIDIFMPSGWQHVYCNCPAPPPATFSAPSSVVVNSSFQVTAPSAPGLTYQWTAVGASPVTSVAAQPTFSYSVAGTYSLKLVVSDASGCKDSTTQQVTAILCPNPPSATFTLPGTTAILNAPFQATGPAGPGLTYAWTATGATPSSSTTQNPSFTYGSTGSYTISLTVTDGLGCTATQSQNITIQNCPAMPMGQSQTFNFTGNAQTFVVPVCVTSLQVDVRGAQGGTGNSGSGAGGLGGRVQTTLAVTPGETLFVYVGGTPNPLEAAGWNGGGSGVVSGGGGGGASDLRRGGQSLNDRIVVAGGGGGGAQGNGGAGGGLTGGQGSTLGAGNWAQGGTQSAGGSGGRYNNGGCSPGAAFAGNGAFGVGGNGLSNSACCCSGTGGGGGWYGGGGMQINGAGGGSGYVNPSGTSSTTQTAGFQSGNGQVILSW